MKPREKGVWFHSGNRDLLGPGGIWEGMSWREKAVALYRYICSFWNMFHIPKTYILNGKFGEQCAEVNCMCSAGPAPISGLQLSVLPWRSRPTDWSSSDINIRRTSRNAAGKTGDSGLLCQKKWKVSERKQPMWMDEQLDKRKLSYISWRTNEDVPDLFLLN